MSIYVTKAAIKAYIKEVMDGVAHAGKFDNAPVTVNAVVDPSASDTNPDDLNYKPTNRAEFRCAMTNLIDDLFDDDAPDAYVAVKDALKNLKDEDDMKEEDKVEESVRLAVRKMIKEAWVKGPNGAEIWTDETPKKGPKKGKPEIGPVTGPLPPVKKLPPETHGGEFNRGVEKYKKDLRKSLKTWDDSSLDDMVDPEARAAGRSRKNTMQTDIGGASFKEIAKEMGFASESGAKQALERIQAKSSFATSMEDEDYQIMVLTAMKDYIAKLVSSEAITPADAQLMKQHPVIVADLDSFRVFLAPYVKKAMKTSVAEAKITKLRKVVREAFRSMKSTKKGYSNK